MKKGGRSKLLRLLPVAALIAALVVFEQPSSGVAPKGACAKEFSAGITGHPIGLTVGPDRKLWFTEQLEDKIGVLDPATGRAREFSVPDGTQPHSIVTGSDGNLWFTAISGMIGRVDPATGAATAVVTSRRRPRLTSRRVQS